jgi:hypothetical protein
MLLPRLLRVRTITAVGVVVRQDADPRKQVPLAGVDVVMRRDELVAHTLSDATGFFTLSLRRGINPAETVTLQLDAPDYHPLTLAFNGDRLYLARMAPLIASEGAVPDHARTVANVLVRYSVISISDANVGSEIKVFQAVNTGNRSCDGDRPCSPDGKWRAAVAYATLDAGAGNEIRDPRVSCIAGPCPFTRVGRPDLSSGLRTVRVWAETWSDTATFLLEAEVFHRMVGETVRRSYPVVFGQSLDFTVPASAEGVTLEAEIDGANVVFPLSPDLSLSWAACHLTVNTDQSKIYLCNLKPGYRFP